MKILSLSFLLFIITTLPVYAQINDIEFYADVMINASDSDHRKHANQKFNTLFKQALSQEDSYRDDFKSLPWISSISPEDSSF